MSDCAICIEDVCFSYEKEMVLKHLSMEISQNRICFIMGNNGSGKTTLLKNMMGFLVPSQGTIKIQEQDILAIDFQLMSRLISYVPQAINLNTDFSVIDYLSLGRTPHLRLSSRLHDEDYKIIDKYTKELGITDILNIPFNKLSGGQKQLVAISRSLIQDTPIIIMDEPMSALDIGKQVDLLRILVNLTKDGKTIILTSHNPNHALVVESNSCFIKQGEVVAYGYSREVINESLLKAIYGDNITLNPGGKNESVVFNLEAN